MKSPAEHVKDILIEAPAIGAFGGLADWAVYLGRQPAGPDRVITVYDTGGDSPEAGLLLSYPAVQVRIRGKVADYLVARNKLQDIQDRLLGITPRTMSNGDRISGIIALGDIGFFGFDAANERPEFVWNMQFFFEPVPTAQNANRLPL